MLFGATSACPACALRFAERPACPACGGPVVSLADPAGRAKAAGAAAPGRTGVALAIGAATTAIGALALSHDRTAVAVIAGVVGLATGTWLGLRARAAPTGPPRALRVHEPAPPPGEDERDEIAGVARRATVEVVAPLSDDGCLAWGLRGEAGGAPIDDADGGDFDLVLPSGAVVMVSLSHAVLLPAASDEPDPRAVEPSGALAAFLRDRGAPPGAASLRESVVREGDVVRVTGTARGAAVSLEGRARARVFDGDADAPLFVQVIARADA